MLTQLLPRSLAALHVVEGIFEKSAFSQPLFFWRSSHVEALLLASLWPALKRGSSQAAELVPPRLAAAVRLSGRAQRPARTVCFAVGSFAASGLSFAGRAASCCKAPLRMRMHAALILLHHHRCLSRLPLQLNHTMCSFCNPALYRLACVFHLSLQEEW